MNQRPREKLSELGPAALEDHELLAIVLSKGNKKENIYSICKRLLAGYAKDDLIQEKNVTELQKSLKIGFVQTCQLVACFELGRRFFAQNIANKSIQSAEEAYYYVKNMQYLQKEHLRGIYINSRHRVIHDEVITIGSMDANIIHPREVFRPAIEHGAYAIILAHNHPSGDPTPSNADIEVTSKLKETGDLIQIPLIDHLIVGNNGYTSLNRFNQLQSLHRGR